MTGKCRNIPCGSPIEDDQVVRRHLLTIFAFCSRLPGVYYSDFQVREEHPVCITGPNDGLVSQVGSLGSLNTLAHAATQSFAFS